MLMSVYSLDRKFVTAAKHALDNKSVHNTSIKH